MPIVKTRPYVPTWLQRKLGIDWIQRLVTMLPLLLVNAVAVGGQLSWSHDHLGSWHLPGQIMFSMAIESIALFLAYHAYLAERSNDSALRLKLASYGCGLAVGTLNYSHYSQNWKPTAVAIVVGGMSASSPWLWGTFSRRVSRPVLAMNGLIDSHALRLGPARWVYHPIRSFKVSRHASWIGENRITKAVAAYDTSAAEIANKRVSSNLDSELKELV